MINVFNYLNNDEFEINIFNKGIHIFNYIKIIELSSNFIRVVVKNKIICISGKNLLINKMDKKELYITGDFKGIDLLDE